MDVQQLEDCKHILPSLLYRRGGEAERQLAICKLSDRFLSVHLKATYKKHSRRVRYRLAGTFEFKPPHLPQSRRGAEWLKYGDDMKYLCECG